MRSDPDFNEVTDDSVALSGADGVAEANLLGWVGRGRPVIALQAGKGVDMDVENASRLFRKACDLGDILACWQLGVDG